MADHKEYLEEFVAVCIGHANNDYPDELIDAVDAALRVIEAAEAYVDEGSGRAGEWKALVDALRDFREAK